jgi:hypothetical protein
MADPRSDAWRRLQWKASKAKASNDNLAASVAVSMAPASAPVQTAAIDSPMDSGNDSASKKENDKQMMLFFRGLGAWALCYVMGYAFDIEEVNTSAAFALLMHSMGFSIFLVVLTNQVRWLALNGVVGE